MKIATIRLIAVAAIASIAVSSILWINSSLVDLVNYKFTVMKPKYHRSAPINEEGLPPLCSSLFNSNSGRSAQLWSTYLPTIVSASQHVDDVGGNRSDATIRNQKLLHFLSPSMLADGLKVRPRPSDVKRILMILEKYRRSPKRSRPLTILVMGGSVTEGRGCRDKTSSGEKIGGNRCTWAFRLEKFANHMLKEILGVEGAVQVVNAASGGTQSNQGSNLIRYWMYPSKILPEGPDIIINAYGMNDNLVNPVKRGQPDEWDITFTTYRKIVNLMNSFIERVYEAHHCNEPMLVYLDDYLGTHRRGYMLYDLTYNTVMTEVMKWYQNMAVSSADVVRRLVLANTNETTFTPHWILREDRFKEEVHFGVDGHMLILWSLAFSALEAFTSFCDAELWSLSHQDKVLTDGLMNDTSVDKKEERTPSPFLDLQALYLANNVNPPPLTNETMLERISEEWLDLAKSRNLSCSNKNQSDQFRSTPCVYAWIAGPEGPTSNDGALNRYLEPFLKKNDGFRCEANIRDGWSRKLGFVATKEAASAVFEVNNLTRSVQYVMVDYLKSYGKKWEGSAARFTSFVKKSGKTEYQKVHEFKLSGFHNITFSLTNSARENIGDDVARIGDSFRMEVDLIGGSTFKITGFMFCNR